jgi:hypothetical protein
MLPCCGEDLDNDTTGRDETDGNEDELPAKRI